MKAMQLVRRVLLKSYGWSFAIRDAMLASDSEFDQGARYELPADFLSVYLLEHPNSYRIEGGFLRRISNRATVDTVGAGGVLLKYIHNSEDIPVFCDIFIEALIVLLAMEVVRSTFNDNAKLQSLVAEHAYYLDLAARIDGAQTGIRAIPRTAGAYTAIRINHGNYYSNGSMLQRMR